MPLAGAGRPAVTVAVLTWQGAHLLADCLDAVLRLDYAGELHVLVVDNGSTDGTEQLLRSAYPQVQLVQNGRNLGFAGGYNAGLRDVRTPFVALLNNDARPSPGWLDGLVGALESPGWERVGAVTSLLLLPDGRVNNAGVVLYSDGYGADRGARAPQGGRYETPCEVFGFTGGAALLRTVAWRAAGGFDDDFFLYYEDTELSWHLRALGWSVRFVPARVEHLHSATAVAGSALFRFYTERNRLLLLARWAGPGRVLTTHVRYLLGAVRALGGRPAEAVFRARVLLACLLLLPASVRRRRSVRRTSVVPRRELDAWQVPIALRRPDGGLTPEALEAGWGERPCGGPAPLTGTGRPDRTP